MLSPRCFTLFFFIRGEAMSFLGDTYSKNILLWRSAATSVPEVLAWFLYSEEFVTWRLAYFQATGHNCNPIDFLRKAPVLGYLAK